YQKWSAPQEVFSPRSGPTRSALDDGPVILGPVEHQDRRVSLTTPGRRDSGVTFSTSPPSIRRRIDADHVLLQMAIRLTRSVRHLDHDDWLVARNVFAQQAS